MLGAFIPFGDYSESSSPLVCWLRSSLLIIFYTFQDFFPHLMKAGRSSNATCSGPAPPRSRWSAASRTSSTWSEADVASTFSSTTPLGTSTSSQRCWLPCSAGSVKKKGEEKQATCSNGTEFCRITNIWLKSWWVQRNVSFAQNFLVPMKNFRFFIFSLFSYLE